MRSQSKSRRATFADICVLSCSPWVQKKFWSLGKCPDFSSKSSFCLPATVSLPSYIVLEMETGNRRDELIPYPLISASVCLVYYGLFLLLPGPRVPLPLCYNASPQPPTKDLLFCLGFLMPHEMSLHGCGEHSLGRPSIAHLCWLNMMTSMAWIVTCVYLVSSSKPHIQRAFG